MTGQSLEGPLAPLDAAHEGWTLLPSRDGSALRNSFVSGDPDGLRLRISYFVRDADSSIVGRAWFGPLAEGPPGHAHGGSMAALLDEAMGAAAWLAGYRVLAAKIAVDFKRPLRLGTTVILSASVARAEGRRVHTRGSLVIPAAGASDEVGGTVCAQAEGLFVDVDVERLRALVGDTNGPIG